MNYRPESPGTVLRWGLSVLMSGFIFYLLTFSSVESCEDILKAFLSAEKLDEKVKNSLLAVDTAMSRIEVSLNRSDVEMSKKFLNEIVDTWMAFYFDYYSTPPVQFEKDPEWQKKLSSVTLNIRKLRELVNESKLEEAHMFFKTVYASFTDIYRNRVSIREQEVIELILEKTSLLLKNSREEKDAFESSVRLNSLKSLYELFLKLETPELSSEARVKYLEDRNVFIHSIEKLLRLEPGRNSFEEIAMAADEVLEKGNSFKKSRLSLLSNEWFEKK